MGFFARLFGETPEFIHHSTSYPHRMWSGIETVLRHEMKLNPAITADDVILEAMNDYLLKTIWITRAKTDHIVQVTHPEPFIAPKPAPRQLRTSSNFKPR